MRVKPGRLGDQVSLEPVVLVVLIAQRIECAPHIVELLLRVI